MQQKQKNTNLSLFNIRRTKQIRQHHSGAGEAIRTEVQGQHLLQNDEGGRQQTPSNKTNTYIS